MCEEVRIITDYSDLFFHKYIMVTDEIKFIKTTPEKMESRNVGGDYPNSFIHTHGSNGDDQLYIGTERITDNLNIGDTNPSMATRKIGGLEASTIGQLQQRSLSEIIIDMLKPDLVEPSVSTNAGVSLSYSGPRLITVGTDLPEESDITVTITDGEWSDGTPYAGGHGDLSLSMDPDSWGDPSTEGRYTISGSATFTEGGIPKDNFGTSYPGMQYAGGTESSTPITITSVYPMKINDGNDITVMVEHLYDYITGENIMVTIPAETEATSEISDVKKFRVEVPYEFTTFNVLQYNPLTLVYDIPVPMKFVSRNTSYYERVDDDTKTAPTKYKINFKK